MYTSTLSPVKMQVSTAAPRIPASAGPVIVPARLARERMAAEQARHMANVEALPQIVADLKAARRELELIHLAE